MPTVAKLDLPDLTLPQGNTRTVRRVLSLYLQRALQDFVRLPLAAVDPANRALFQQTSRLLADLSRRDPRKAVHVARLPTISTLVQTMTAQAVAGGDTRALNAWLRECCALVLLELAVLQELPPQGLTLGRDAAGRLPILRTPTAQLQLEAGESVAALHFANGILELRMQAQTVAVPLDDLAFTLPEPGPARLTRPYHEIVPGLFLATGDNNPLSDFEAHPDKHGNQLDLGGHPVQAWVDVLRRALALVDAHLPLLGEELRLVMKLIVPVGWHAEQHLSASYQEAIGLLYLTLHPNLMTMTEALIHEFQHNKLNAAFHLDGLLENAWSPLFASPVRPDPRPLHGVVLAVHAFQPVAALYEAMLAADDPESRSAHFDQRFQQIVRLNHEGATTVLDNAVTTATGTGFFAEMRSLDEHFARLAARRWPAASFDETAPAR